MMYNNFGGGFGQGMMGGGAGWLPLFGAGFGLLLLWSIVWKGLALWHSARRNEPWWFLALILINTMGILEIVYLFVVLKLRLSEILPKTNHKKDTGHSSQ